MNNNSRQALLSIGIALLCLSASASAQRGGGGRGGGGRMASRGGARSSVTSRPAGGGNFNGNVDRSTTNANINRSNVNVNRPINVNDFDNNDNRYNRGTGCCARPVAGAAVVGAAAVATAAAMGSVAYALPASCTVVVVEGSTYQQCGSSWYRPQFVGTTTTYVVVSSPQ